MQSTSKQDIYIGVDAEGRNYNESIISSCFGDVEQIPRNKTEIIDYFEKQYKSNDMDTGDKSSTSQDDFGLNDGLQPRFNAQDVETVMLEITGLNTFEGIKYEDIEFQEMENDLQELELYGMKEEQQEKQEIHVFEIQENLCEIEDIQIKKQSSPKENIKIKAKKSLKSYKISKRNSKKKMKKSSKQSLKQQKDQTKNTVKNFGKGIIIFIKKQIPTVEKLLVSIGSKLTQFELVKQLNSIKGQLTRIQHLKDMWTNQVYRTEMRIITQYFLRKYTWFWIFNSRVQKVSSPLKYRLRLLQAVKNPEMFNTLKWY